MKYGSRLRQALFHNSCVGAPTRIGFTGRLKNLTVQNTELLSVPCGS